MPSAGPLDRPFVATPTDHRASCPGPLPRPCRLARTTRGLRQGTRGRCHRAVLRVGAVRRLTAGDRSRWAHAAPYLTAAVRCCRARRRVPHGCCRVRRRVLQDYWCDGRRCHGRGLPDRGCFPDHGRCFPDHGRRRGLRHGAGLYHGEPTYPRAEIRAAGCRNAGAAVRHRSSGSQEAAAAPYRGVLVSRVARGRHQGPGSAARTPCHHTI